MLIPLSSALYEYLCDAGYLIYAHLGHRISGLGDNVRPRLHSLWACSTVRHYFQYFNRMSMQNSMR